MTTLPRDEPRFIHPDQVRAAIRQLEADLRNPMLADALRDLEAQERMATLDAINFCRRMQRLMGSAQRASAAIQSVVAYKAN